MTAMRIGICTACLRPVDDHFRPDGSFVRCAALVARQQPPWDRRDAYARMQPLVNAIRRNLAAKFGPHQERTS
jgi:hypothetical protein